MKLLKKHDNLENIIKEKELDIPNCQEVRDIFLKPDVIDDYKIAMGTFSEDRIIKLLVDDYEFSESRVTSALKKVKDRKKEEGQKKLDCWF